MNIPIFLPLAAQFLVGVVDAVPVYDVAPSCRGAAMSAHDSSRLQACLDTEHKARETLAEEWTQFAPAARQNCQAAASVGGEPSYTELLTCLEIQRDVKRPPAG